MEDKIALDSRTASLRARMKDKIALDLRKDLRKDSICRVRIAHQTLYLVLDLTRKRKSYTNREVREQEWKIK